MLEPLDDLGLLGVEVGCLAEVVLQIVQLARWLACFGLDATRLRKTSRAESVDQRSDEVM